MASQKEQVNELQEKVGLITSRLSFLEGGEGSPLGKLQTELTTVQARIAQVQLDHQTKLDDTLGDIGSRMDSIDDQFKKFSESSAQTIERFTEKVTFWWKVVGVAAGVVSVVLTAVISFPLKKIYDNTDRIADLNSIPGRVANIEKTLNEQVVPQVSQSGILPKRIDDISKSIAGLPMKKLDDVDQIVTASVSKAIDEKAKRLEDVSGKLGAQQEKINELRGELEKLVYANEKRIVVQVALRKEVSSETMGSATKLIFEPEEAPRLIGPTIEAMRVHSIEYAAREDLAQVPFNLDAQIKGPTLRVVVTTTKPEEFRASLSKEPLAIRVYLFAGLGRQ